MKYRILVTEFSQSDLIVEAKSAKEAEQKAYREDYTKRFEYDREVRKVISVDKDDDN